MRLILGYGNVLRRDDGLGVWLAELPRAGWESVTAQQLLPEHAEVISRAERVVFVDAEMSDGDGMAGAVHICKVTPEAAENPVRALGAFSHNATPATLLAAARALYGSAPPALLVCVTGAEFGHGEGFSAPIQARLSGIAEEVERALDGFTLLDAAHAPLESPVAEGARRVQAHYRAQRRSAGRLSRGLRRRACALRYDMGRAWKRR